MQQRVQLTDDQNTAFQDAAWRWNDDMRGLAREVVEVGFGAALGDAVRDSRQTEAIVVFGGHFNSGKSSLLNALLERRLLPTAGLPETGVSCYLRAAPGTCDEANRISGSESSPIPCTLEAIHREIALVSQAGERTAIVHCDRLEINLADSPLPANVCWVDSPGIADEADTTEIATNTAAAGDALVWVLTSRQALSKTEVDFIACHIAKYGSASVLFVLNVFLDNDTEAEWNAFLAHDFETIQTRLDARAAVMGFPPNTSVPVLPVSSRGAATQGLETFGGRQVQAALLSLVATSPRIRRARFSRAGVALIEVADKVSKLNSEASEAQIARKNAAVKREAAFTARIKQIVEKQITGLGDEVMEAVESTMYEVEQRQVSPGDVSSRLRSTSVAVAAAVSNRLSDALRETLNEWHREDRTAAIAPVLRKAIRNQITPAVAIPAEVHYTGLGVRNGAALGGVVGSFLLFGVGTALGAAVGAGLGRMNERRAGAAFEQWMTALRQEVFARYGDAVERSFRLVDVLTAKIVPASPEIEQYDEAAAIEVIRSLRSLECRLRKLAQRAIELGALEADHERML